ncbi:T9SS type A sorting domain-containing protein [bacterium]|nr:T9SS type A sorting domain-containing protein [bacterium]
MKPLTLSVLLLAAVPMLLFGMQQTDNATHTHNAGSLILPSRALWHIGLCPHVAVDAPQYYADLTFWAGAKVAKSKYAVSTAHLTSRKDSPDWEPVPGTWNKLEKTMLPAMQGGESAQFTDIVKKKGHTPLGLIVECQSMGFDTQGYVIYRYTATLKDGAGSLNAFYLGMEVDIDAPNPQGRLTPQDDELTLLTNGNGYIFSDSKSQKSTDNVIGISYLGSNTPIISSWRREAEPLKEKDQYMALAGQAGYEKSGKGLGDWRFLISDGPYDLEPGQSITFTIAVAHAKGAEKLTQELDKANALILKHLPESTIQRSTPAAQFAEAMLSGPTELRLYPVYPNPFNNTVQIRYDLPEDLTVEASIYNMRGRRVATLASGSTPRGVYKLRWSGRDNNGREVGSGVYFLILKVGDTLLRQKLILIK